MKKRIRMWYDRESHKTTTPGPSMAKQGFASECNINKIMEKFERTGLLDHVYQYQGRYGDFTNTPSSYHDAMNQILAAQDMFASLPARIRKEFDNDPGRFLDFVDNPDNENRMREMGLLPEIPDAPVESKTAAAVAEAPAPPEAPARASEGSGMPS